MSATHITKSRPVFHDLGQGKNQGFFSRPPPPGMLLQGKAPAGDFPIQGENIHASRPDRSPAHPIIPGARRQAGDPGMMPSSPWPGYKPVPVVDDLDRSAISDFPGFRIPGFSHKAHRIASSPGDIVQGRIDPVFRHGAYHLDRILPIRDPRPFQGSMVFGNRGIRGFRISAIFWL